MDPRHDWADHRWATDRFKVRTPNRQTIFYQRNILTLLAVIVATGSASIHFVKYSIATIKNFRYRDAKGKRTQNVNSPGMNGQGVFMECRYLGGARWRSECR